MVLMVISVKIHKLKIRIIRLMGPPAYMTLMYGKIGVVLLLCILSIIFAPN